MNATTTKPVPADRDQPTAPGPVRKPVSLAELAMAQGIAPELVGRYLASRAVPSYRLVASVIALSQVGGSAAH